MINFVSMSDIKRIVVTGASKGIGFQIVQQLAAQGHIVYAVSRNIQPLLTAGSSFKTLIPVQADITTGVKEIQEVIEDHKVDLLINNAGLLVNKPIAEMQDQDIQFQFDVNVMAPLRLIRDLLLSFNPLGASIINITSMGGVQGTAKFPGLSAYSSSKGALTILTECLAEELKERNISCNAIALGAVQTEMLEQAFPGYVAPVMADEMAQYIVDFALNRSSLFNGKTIQVANSTP